ncbi:MAG: hypothetical protein AB7U75_13890 [Hyphomicrobiaceae bacterium]
MSWNYRVIRREIDDGGQMIQWFGIHEVYYAEDGVTPRMASADPVKCEGEDMPWLIDALFRALTLPVLDENLKPLLEETPGVPSPPSPDSSV